MKYNTGENLESSEPSAKYKYASPQEAYKKARRSIVNNALRRKQASLDLSNYGLTEIPPEIGELSNLLELDISNNQLTSLPVEIEGLTELVELNAGTNKLISIPPQIGKLSRLRRLLLQKNKLRNIPKEFSNLKSLRFLYLDGNNFKEFPSALTNLQALLRLHLSENELVSFPERLGGLTSLTDLSLESNQIKELASIGTLTNLQSLDLDGNGLSSLPPEFGKLKRLTALYLNRNSFKEIPSVVFDLSSLESLMLTSNNLVEVSPNISNLRNLQRLRLYGNSIRELPREIGELRQLTLLNISNNRLANLPRELGEIRSLEAAAMRDSEPIRDGLWIGENPLPDPYPKLISVGQPTATINVLAWLRGETDEASIKSEAVITPDVTAPDEPTQEAGPTFHISSGQLDLLPSFETASDFDKLTQQTLLRRLHRQVEALREATAKVGNQHPQLSAVVEEYSNLIKPEIGELDIVDLWAVGNALMAQAGAFERHDQGRTLTEPLEPTHQGLLSEVAALHGGFILGFPRAAELTSRADHSRIGPEVMRAIGAPTSNVLSALTRQRRLLSERARQLIEALDAALLPGSWDAARIGYTSYATVRNALVVIGRIAIWVNDKGGSLVGGVAVGSGLAAMHIAPETLELVLLFLSSNSADILSFAAPFPELRLYLQWIIDHFDDLSAKTEKQQKEIN